MRIFNSFLVCSCLLLHLPLAAQEGEGESKRKEPSGKNKKVRPPTEITIVALGPMPGRRYGDRGQMLRARPYETPPSRLYYKGKKKGSKKAAWQTLNLSFNNPSAMQVISPGKKLDLHEKLSNDGGYKKYVTIPAGVEGSRRVFFLLTSTKGPTPWKETPIVRTIAVSSESLKGKQFILKNLSRFTVLHAFEDSVVSVAPTKVVSYKRANTGQLYRLAAQYGTRKKILYNTAVRLNGEGHIHLFALYDANPRTNSGRSVGVFRTMIPAKVIPNDETESE